MLEVCQTFLIVHWSTFCVHPRSIVGARIKNIVRQSPGVGLSVGNGWATLKQCCQCGQLANAGADLRADIFSMKPVSCGENKNDAMFERIMSEVGGGR